MNQPRVLAVDDSPIAIRKYQSLLTANGFEFFGVMDPAFALDAIAQFKPDIILMDQIMPGINGMDLTRNIVGTPGLEKMKIIMISSDKKKETVVAAVQAGAVDFLMKPFDDAALIAKIRLRLAKK